MNVNVTVTGVDEAIARLEKAENIKQPLLEACEDLINIARIIVISRYSLQGNGNDDFYTNVEPIENGYRLSVIGEDVGFLEFGAGVFTEKDEFADDVNYPIYPGSWSELHEHSDNPNARYFAKNGFWWWSNIRYTGLIATRGMQRGLDEIRMQAEQVVKRKIDEWLGN